MGRKWILHEPLNLSWNQIRVLCCFLFSALMSTRPAPSIHIYEPLPDWLTSADSCMSALVSWKTRQRVKCPQAGRKKLVYIFNKTEIKKLHFTTERAAMCSWQQPWLSRNRSDMSGELWAFNQLFCNFKLIMGKLGEEVLWRWEKRRREKVEGCFFFLSQN